MGDPQALTTEKGATVSKGVIPAGRLILGANLIGLRRPGKLKQNTSRYFYKSVFGGD